VKAEEQIAQLETDAANYACNWRWKITSYITTANQNDRTTPATGVENAELRQRSQTENSQDRICEARSGKWQDYANDWMRQKTRITRQRLEAENGGVRQRCKRKPPNARQRLDTANDEGTHCAMVENSGVDSMNAGGAMAQIKKQGLRAITERILIEQPPSSDDPE